MSSTCGSPLKQQLVSFGFARCFPEKPGRRKGWLWFRLVSIGRSWHPLVCCGLLWSAEAKEARWEAAGDLGLGCQCCTSCWLCSARASDSRLATRGASTPSAPQKSGGGSCFWDLGGSSFHWFQVGHVRVAEWLAIPFLRKELPHSFPVSKITRPLCLKVAFLDSCPSK